jgi:hypothetical protein
MKLSLLVLGVAGALASENSTFTNVTDSYSDSYSDSYTYGTEEISDAQNEMFESMLLPLWEQTDVDGSGDLSETEFESALAKLGISADVLTSHSQSYAVLFADLDEDGDGALTQTELAAAAAYPEYQAAFMSAFTNDVAEIPDIGDVIPSDDVIAAGATVQITLVVSGSPEAIYAGQREMITEYFAALANVDSSMVIITFLSADRRRLTDTWEQKLAAIKPGKRKLSETTVIEATIFVEDATAAESAYAAMPESAADLSGVAAFDNIEVTEIEAATEMQFPDLPFATIGIVGLVLLGVGFLLCSNARFWAGKAQRKKKAKGEKPGGGCCSLNAVKPWAFGELVAAACIVGTMFYLYQNVTGVTNAIIGMIETLVAIILFVNGIESDSPMATLASFSDNIPEGIIEPIEENLKLLRLLPIAVIVPGLFAAFFLLLASLCPLSKANKGSYCCTKCMILLADILLVVCIGFYATFAGFAVAITYAPPAIKEQISFIRNMCVTVPALLEQRISDAQQTVAMLEEAGQAEMLGEISKSLGDVTTIAEFAIDACGYLSAFFEEMMAIFLPGLMCVVAIVFALFVNKTLCCAAGCCCYGPPKPPKVDAAKSQAGLQNI